MRGPEAGVHFVEHLLGALHGVGPVPLLRFGIGHQRKINRIRKSSSADATGERGGGNGVSRIKTYSELEHGLRRPRDVIAGVVARERDRGADVVEGAGNRRGMRAGEATVRCQSRVLYTKHDVSRIARTETKINLVYHVARSLHVYDVEQIAAAAEVPDGPLDGVLGLLGAVDGDHEVALVLVVAGAGGVERWEGSFPQEM